MTYEIHGLTKASPTAVAYSTSDAYPLMSEPMASARTESRPFARMSARTRIAYANPAASATVPYAAAGSGWRYSSRSHSVRTGMSESQNNRNRFAHIAAPLNRSAALSRVVVVVPVDPDDDKAEHVHEKPRQLVVDGTQRGTTRGPQLERHDRDDHRQDGVAERLDPGRPHLEWPSRTLLVLHRMKDQERSARPLEMGTARVEAFSDAVLAVIITIMAFELRAPRGASLGAVYDQLPGLLVYMLSFVVVGSTG